jgi:hypothetical protein
VPDAQPRNGLDLNQNDPGYDQIKLLPRNQPVAIPNEHFLLALEFDSTTIQFKAVGTLVDDFPLTGTKPAVHADRAAYALPDNSFVFWRNRWMHNFHDSPSFVSFVTFVSLVIALCRVPCLCGMHAVRRGAAHQCRRAAVNAALFPLHPQTSTVVPSVSTNTAPSCAVEKISAPISR